MIFKNIINILNLFSVLSEFNFVLKFKEKYNVLIKALF